MLKLALVGALALALTACARDGGWIAYNEHGRPIVVDANSGEVRALKAGMWIDGTGAAPDG